MNPTNWPPFARRLTADCIRFYLRVAGDAAERYQFECEQKELNTDDSASFHLTVTDTKNPDADLSTPSHDENTTVQRAASL